MEVINSACFVLGEIMIWEITELMMCIRGNYEMDDDKANNVY